MSHPKTGKKLDLSKITNISTLVLHSDTEPLCPDVAPPIHVSTTFRSGNEAGFVYSRSSQPTRSRVEQVLGALEGGIALTYASGLAAETAVLNHVKPKTLIFIGVGYHGTKLSVDAYVSNRGKDSVKVSTKPENIEKGALVFIESPRNPDCQLIDIAYYATLAHKASAYCVVDSTFATPILQKPLELGADFVCHACTKFLGGHSDVLGGVVVCKDATTAAKLASERTATGAVLGSLESFLLLRSLRTLPIRMKQHCRNALKIAKWLDTQKQKVAVVHSPCLESDPSHELWKKTMKYAPPCFSFEMKSEKHATQLLQHLQLFVDCTSLGGCESSIDWRYRWDSAVSPNLLRISVGLEGYEDLIQDLTNAFNQL